MHLTEMKALRPPPPSSVANIHNPTRFYVPQPALKVCSKIKSAGRENSSNQMPLNPHPQLYIYVEVTAKFTDRFRITDLILWLLPPTQ
jgi:hypothetical protein